MEYFILIKVYDFYIQHAYPKIVGIIYLDTPVEECIKRISKRNRKEEANTDESYLKAIK